MAWSSTVATAIGTTDATSRADISGSRVGEPSHGSSEGSDGNTALTLPMRYADRE